eukprot:4758792-Alexandrium_andersonii.AAC.1
MSDLIDAVIADTTHWARAVVACKLAASRIEKEARSKQAQHRGEKRASLSADLNAGGKGLATLMRLLREPSPGRLCVLRTSEGISCDPE